MKWISFCHISTSGENWATKLLEFYKTLKNFPLEDRLKGENENFPFVWKQQCSSIELATGEIFNFTLLFSVVVFFIVEIQHSSRFYIFFWNWNKRNKTFVAIDIESFFIFCENASSIDFFSLSIIKLLSVAFRMWEKIHFEIYFNLWDKLSDFS